MSLPIPALPTDSILSISSVYDSVILPSTVSLEEDLMLATPYHEELVGRDGGFRTRSPHFEPRGLTLFGRVLSKATADSIKRTMAGKRVTITRSTPVSVSITGDIVELNMREVVTGSVWELSITIQASEPFWTATKTVSGSVSGLIDNSGDFESFPTFVVTAGSGGLASINFTLNGREAEWTGNAVDGDIVEINCKRLTATHAGNNALNEMNDSFFALPPLFYPGVGSGGFNSLSVTVNGSATWTTSFDERYY